MPSTAFTGPKCFFRPSHDSCVPFSINTPVYANADCERMVRDMPSNRRSFLTLSGAALAAPAFSPSAAAADSPMEHFKLGVASSSFREFSRGYTIKALKQLNVPYINIKEFHLPYRSTPDEIARARKEFERGGIQILGGGNISLAKNDPADIEYHFQYAKNAGMPVMVCAPTAE